MLGTMLRGSKVYQRAAEIGLEPAGEVHRDRGRRDADVAKIARAIARRNVHATAECDRRVGIVAANAGGFVERRRESDSRLNGCRSRRLLGWASAACQGLGR